MSSEAARRFKHKLVLLALAGVVLILVLLFAFWRGMAPGGGSEFVQVMTSGANYYEQGEIGRASELFEQALALQPANPQVHLNLANCYLRNDQPEAAVKHTAVVLEQNPSSAAALYLKGCAHNRLNQPQEAVQALQQAQFIDADVPAVSYQLGLAHQQLQQWEEAIEALQLAILLQPDHPAAHYNLSQVLLRAGRDAEAQLEIERHQQLVQAGATANSDRTTLEECVYTQPQVPFVLEQPSEEGVPVRFTDVTSVAFGSLDGSFHGPVGVIDVGHDGHYDLFAGQGGAAFRLLANSNGVFQTWGEPLQSIEGAKYHACLVGDLQKDLQNDPTEDVVLLGDAGSHVFQISTNGNVRDATSYSGLKDLAATDGALLDLDFTGKLDLVAVTSSNDVRLLRSLGNMMFRDHTSTSGIPVSITQARQVTFNDWNNDDLMDLFVSRAGASPLLMLKERGGPLVATNFPVPLPSGNALAVGDLNNDLRVDIAVATSERLTWFLNGLDELAEVSHDDAQIRHLAMVDYDNDGWLDVIGAGDFLHLWRNVGRSGLRDVTEEVGLGNVPTSDLSNLALADFDLDGDTDVLLAFHTESGAGLKLWRNDGGDANYQIKLQLTGNRSNTSGLGVRIEIKDGGLRLIRTVKRLPVEIGVGQHRTLESLTARWVDLAMPFIDVEVNPRELFPLTEWTLPQGSCPYLYAWDGDGFRFVTDLLGAAPAGLPMSDTALIPADVDEHVWIGNESMFPPRGSEYVVQITEELREVLYLDQAQLMVVDHPPETEVHASDKLMPGPPFPPSEIVTLHREYPLRKAVRHDGAEVTEALRRVDQIMVSPLQLRVPQLRGLAAPHSVTLDFGPLPVERPLVLALTGWLQFGGGLANVSASHHPDLPYPFPVLEAETADGNWQRLSVTVGAPCGKTKTIVIDLTDQLPTDSRRLRLSAAFEIHWDRIALFERADNAGTQITTVSPTVTDLHWRGYSKYLDLPKHLPLTPDYDRVFQKPFWRTTVSGWCTRYGPVDDLVRKRDDALVLVNGGDELTLAFRADQLPPKPDGFVRDFFLYTVGWEKDGDFHVVDGLTVEPLPFHGMDDQLYGQIPRPVIDGDWWMEEYNTRWVGPYALERKKQ